MKKVIFLLLLIPTLSFGQIPDPKPNTYVNDLSGKLSSEQLHTLNESILAIEKKSSVQIAVVLMDKLPDNMSVEDYSLEIGRKWHVGNAANGLVYVAAISDRKQRLDVARNLEHQITDVAALEITNSIKPFFRNQDYYGGLNQLIKGIDEKLNPIVAEQKQLGAAELQKKEDENASWWWLIIGAITLSSMALIAYRINIKKQKLLEKEYEDLKKANTPSNNYGLSSIATGVGVGAITGAYTAALLRKREEKRNTYTPPITDTDDTYTRSSYTPPSTSYSSPSSNDSSYGNWGSGSSDSGSSSSDSGYSGGGSSNDW